MGHIDHISARQSVIRDLVYRELLARRVITDPRWQRVRTVGEEDRVRELAHWALHCVAQTLRRHAWLSNCVLHCLVAAS